MVATITPIPKFSSWPKRPVVALLILGDGAFPAQNIPPLTLLVAGVRFMGETAKILSPGKRPS